MKIYHFGTTCLAAVTMFLLSFLGFAEEAKAGLIAGSSTFSRTLSGTVTGSMTYGDLFTGGSINGQTVFSTVDGNGSNFFIFFRRNSGGGASIPLGSIANGGHYGATGLASYFPPSGITGVTVTPLASGVTVGAITTNLLAPTNGLTLHSPFTSNSFRTIASNSIGIGPSITVGYEVTAVPEPTSLCLVGIGLVGLVVRRRRRKSA